MKLERAMQLLNSIIDYVAVGENISTQIQTLIKMGFTEEELVQEFSYRQDDVDNAMENDDEDDDEEDDE